MTELTDRLGVRRVLSPVGVLPQAADRLDAALPMQPFELELSVDTLAIDSTSFRQVRETAGGDPARMADAVLSIVAERGKMHNPVTGSGGVLTGTVAAVGAAYRSPPPVGSRIIPLSSLSITPLRLDSVGELSPASPHVPVRGVAYLTDSIPWAPYPADLDTSAAIAALDACTAPTQVRELITPATRTVTVLGGGHGGLLSLAAARDALADGARIALLDSSEERCARATRLGLCDLTACTDLQDPLRALADAERAGLPRADLTVVVVNATGCESAAQLLTHARGTILFFSMATSFTRAALGSEDVGSSARMVIGSSYAADRGAYALELLRRDSRLVQALSEA